MESVTEEIQLVPAEPELIWIPIVVALVIAITLIVVGLRRRKTRREDLEARVERLERGAGISP